MSLAQQYTGRLRYLAAPEPTVYLVGIPCLVGELTIPEVALLDTAAEWCVLRPDTAAELGIEAGTGAGAARLSTRLGQFVGSLERIRLTLVPEDGESLQVDATWFVSSDWPGPMVLGWRGVLERIAFALNPSEGSFYFGKL